MARQKLPPRTQFAYVLLLSSLVSIGLFIYGAYRNHSWEFAYFIWNLFLAWLPLLFAVWLMAVLHRKRWSSWEGLMASALWLLFLPNSFYMVSDFIHLEAVKRINLLYDSVMFTSFIFVGVFLGLTSLYLVHSELRKRVTRFGSALWLVAIFILCGFAIYLGRDLRWNSWDILTNPAGLLFDISDRLMHPRAYPQMLLTISSFFVFLSSMYGLAYKTVELIRHPD